MCLDCERLRENPSQRGAHLPLPGIRTLQLRNLSGEVTCPICRAEWSKYPMQAWHLVKAPEQPKAKRAKWK